MESTAVLLDRIATCSRPLLWTLAVGLALGLGAIDYATGFEVSFAFFYIAPVAVASWGVGRIAGLAVSILSAVTWLSANQLAGEVASHWLIPYWNALTRVGFFFVVTLLASALRRQLELERRLARTDPLTGLSNRRAFYERLSAEIAAVSRHGRPLTLLAFDLDGFKRVNDELGHDVGDHLLCRVATRLCQTVRRQDVGARLGGDEFAVLLPETDGVAARRLVPRLREALHEEMEERSWPVTFSIGALTTSESTKAVDDLLGTADRLMYRAKSAGKDGIEFSEAGDGPADPAAVAMSSVRRAQ